jgi:hypothetical protein
MYKYVKDTPLCDANADPHPEGWHCRRRRDPKEALRRVAFMGPALSSAVVSALHEAGHAVAWHMGGGEICDVSIRREVRGWVGRTTYIVDPLLSRTQRRLLARALFAGPIACAVAGYSLGLAQGDDYEVAVHILSPLYSSRSRLHRAASECWMHAAELMSSPTGFWSTSALAGQLLRGGTLCGFPPACHVVDHQFDHRLSEAAARLRASYDWEIAEALAGAVSLHETPLHYRAHA